MCVTPVSVPPSLGQCTTPHPFIQMFKPVLLLALDDYFFTVTRLFGAIVRCHQLDESLRRSGLDVFRGSSCIIRNARTSLSKSSLPHRILHHLKPTEDVAPPGVASSHGSHGSPPAAKGGRGTPRRLHPIANTRERCRQARVYQTFV
ncbi:hypothetical protein BGW80DRAFT_894887 [Lactifluus volemus]|nr:hypothetical protein BGW80DRAFT_894887 [Lactifluus volemus]